MLDKIVPLPDEIPATPTQTGPDGIFFDFNDGCRISFPQGNWRVRLRDSETDTVLFDQSLTVGNVQSTKRYYVKFEIEIWSNGQSIYRHVFDAANKPVLVDMERGGIGDHLAWFGHAEAFSRKHKCHLVCRVRRDVRALFEDKYPNVTFISGDERAGYDYYASYKVLIFYNDDNNSYQPCDYRSVGLCNTAAYILGLRAVERLPEISISQEGRPIAERYVCIATQASSQSKYWNNPHGWSATISFLREHGYRVICIDQKPIYGQGLIWNHIPHGAEDMTGNAPLTERARWLKYADFFVGLSSGLAWLAWASKIPVVMISGFTHPNNEFYTPYRVINWHTCNSCSNDIRLRLDPSDYMWCPRHKGSERQFECTRLISAEQVKATIKLIPEFSTLKIR